jgi:hypothetical protein
VAAYDFTAEDGRFELRLNLDEASVAASPDPTASGYTKVQNLLLNQQGYLRRRGVFSGCRDTNMITDATTPALRSFLGQLPPGAEHAPYYIFETTGATTTVYTSSGSYSSGAMGSVDTYPVGVSPLLNNVLFFAGGDALEDYLPGSGYDYGIPPVCQLGGTEHASYTTGTATFTTGSRTVTGAGGCVWHTGMIGSFIANTNDTDRYYYRITDVTSSTTLQIDQLYAGSRTGVADTYTLRAVSQVYGNFAGTHQLIEAKVLAAHWGRLVLADIPETESGVEVRRGNRIRWSGIAGSTEGTAPTYGMYSFNTSGYLDLPSESGRIVGMYPHGGALVVLAEKAMHVLRGAPTFDTAGSLDASTIYTGMSPLGSRGALSTPYGFYFLDRTHGLMLWDGSGHPRPVESQRQTLYSFGFVELGYYRDHLLLCGLEAYETQVLHVPTGRWSTWASVSSDGTSTARGLYDVQPGRVERRENLIAKFYTDSGGVANVSNAIDAPGDESYDVTGGYYPIADLETGVLGPLDAHIKPERIVLTYRLPPRPVDGATATYLDVIVSSGLQSRGAKWDSAQWDVDVWEGEPDAARLFTSSPFDFPQSKRVQTVRGELNVSRDIGFRVRVRQAALASQRFDLYAVTITGSYEGRGESENS